MAQLSPYLYRRGNIFNFRISVPLELRNYVGFRELTKTLLTSDMHLAYPLALELAAISKRLFFDLRLFMTNKKSPMDIKTRVIVAQEEIKRRVLKESHQEELTKNQDMLVLQRQMYEAKIQTYQDALNRLTGFNSSARPTVNLTTTPSKTHKLSELIPVWQSMNNPAKSSIKAFTFTISRFEMLFPKLNVENITANHMNEFVEKLQALKLSPRTISKEHSMIRALLSIAKGKNLIKTNPASGTLLPSIKTPRPPVRGYTTEELFMIFHSPVYKSRARPPGCRGEAGFWIPLLLLYTGARREEICQLTTNRVRKEKGVDVLDIDTIEENGNLKTAGSIRTVPIHSKLIELGFLIFVDDVRINPTKSKMLFPQLKQNSLGQYGQKWGDWCGKYLKREVGITDGRVSPAHSFRHLFITETRRSALSADIARALTGHSTGKQDDHSAYGEYPLKVLQDSINKISFEDLDLTHLLEQNN